MSTVDRITSLAKQKGITQAFICDQFNLNRNWFATIRKYNIKISDERLNIIAGILGTTVAYLKEETDDPAVPSLEKEKSPSNDGLSENEKVMLQLFRTVPEDRQTELLSLIESALKMNGLLQ